MLFWKQKKDEKVSVQTLFLLPCEKDTKTAVPSIFVSFCFLLFEIFDQHNIPLEYYADQISII